MSSLYRRSDSPYWWLSFWNGASAKWLKKSTGLRFDDPVQTAQARQLKAAADTKEARTKDSVQASGGWNFVPEFIRSTAPTEKTAARYLSRWTWISFFLAERDIRTPADVRYEHGGEYVKWRSTYKKRTGKVACRNTGIYETKLWAMIMDEASRRRLCGANPLVRMKLRKDPVAEKPEITDEEFKLILPALDTNELEDDRDWMKRSFLIAMHTGCRLRDTRIEARHWDCIGRKITFAKPKGGEIRAYTIPMPEPLWPLFDELRRSKARVTLEFPLQPSRKWQQFFHRLGLDHLCFHCTRVTFITRLARQDVKLSSAMRLVNHASETIHRVYQRLSVADVSSIPNLFAGLGSAGSPSDQTAAGKPGSTGSGTQAALPNHEPPSSQPPGQPTSP